VVRVDFGPNLSMSLLGCVVVAGTSSLWGEVGCGRLGSVTPTLSVRESVGGKKKRAVRHTLGPPTLWVPLCSSSPTAMVFASTCCHHRRLRYDYPSFVVAFAVVVVWSYSSLLGVIGLGSALSLVVGSSVGATRRYWVLIGIYW
jgi:hypothetical protein